MKYYRVEILAVQMARQLIACVEINTFLLQSWDGLPDSWGVRFRYSLSALELRGRCDPHNQRRIRGPAGSG